MKRVILTLLLLSMSVVLWGCATSTMTTTKTLPDGTVIEYKVNVDIIGQDLAGTDLSVSLNPEGRTTIRAGAVNTTTTQVTADVAASMVELIRIMLPYMAAPAVP